MLVAVTGAGGFIGGHLVRGLEARGWRVRPLLRPDCSPDKIERALAGVDVVVHAAAKTRAPTVAELVASNVDLTRRVAEAANRANAKRVILLSSQAAAGPAVALDRPVTEADAPSPIEEYGKTKLAAE